LSANSININNSVVSRAAPFTGTQILTGTLPVTAAGATLTFNKVGQYLVDIALVGTAITNVAPTVTGTAQNTLVEALFANAAATAGSLAYIVNVKNIGETMIFDFTASATTITFSTVRIGTYAFING